MSVSAVFANPSSPDVPTPPPAKLGSVADAAWHAIDNIDLDTTGVGPGAIHLSDDAMHKRSGGLPWDWDQSAIEARWQTAGEMADGGGVMDYSESELYELVAEVEVKADALEALQRELERQRDQLAEREEHLESKEAAASHALSEATRQRGDLAGTGNPGEAGDPQDGSNGGGELERGVRAKRADDPSSFVTPEKRNSQHISVRQNASEIDRLQVELGAEAAAREAVEAKVAELEASHLRRVERDRVAELQKQDESEQRISELQEELSTQLARVANTEKSLANDARILEAARAKMAVEQTRLGEQENAVGGRAERLRTDENAAARRRQSLAEQEKKLHREAEGVHSAGAALKAEQAAASAQQKECEALAARLATKLAALKKREGELADTEARAKDLMRQHADQISTQARELKLEQLAVAQAGKRQEVSEMKLQADLEVVKRQADEASTGEAELGAQSQHVERLASQLRQQVRSRPRGGAPASETIPIAAC